MIFNVRLILAIITDFFTEHYVERAYAGRISTTELVDRIYNFCEVYSGRVMYKYQTQFSKRIIRSVLENDGAEITALFARQSGKTETIAITVGGLMIILPQLANMPMFADDPRLQMFKDGLWVGIFAPSQRQAQITYRRMRSRIQCKESMAILEDPDFRLEFSTSNGQTVALTNGSFVTAISASDGSNIEGESFKFIICEECQDISNYKIRKSIHPMGAAYNATICKIGTATTFKGDFYEAIQRNKKDYEEKKIKIRNHFEYNYKVVQKYNPKYAKYIEREKRSLGENSDEFRMSYCVSPETRILTSDLRWVRADSIKAGDKLIGFDENPPKRYGQRKFKETLVEDVGEIERSCYEVTLNDGTKVTCSEEHQWLVFTAGSRTVWKQTKDLMPTDRIYKVCDVWEDLPQDYRLGYLSASFDGEGCISQIHPKVESINYVGNKKVIPIRTTSHTYVAEGLASHNCLEWIISRGMFVDIDQLEEDCGDVFLDRVDRDLVANHTVGIDVGGGSDKKKKDADSTVVTVVEVDWDNPVVMESSFNEETQEEEIYLAYNTYIKDWLKIGSEIAEDYEEQYAIIMDYLKNFRISKLVVDATRESSLGQRIRANVSYDVELFVFSTKSKSDLYKNLDKEINSGRAKFPRSPDTVNTKEYQEFIQQMGDLEKGYSGSNLVVSHPPERGAHDDYADSWALALWGAREPGVVDNTETKDRNRVFGNTKPTSRYGLQNRSRNRFTARRRR